MAASSHRKAVGLATVLTTFVIVLSTVTANAAPRPYGASVGTWSARWWQWAFSVPFDGDHPLLDETGTSCMSGQSSRGFVHLAGVFNASGTASRDCAIPVGRGTFFPAINVECSSLEDAPYYGNDAASLEACVNDPLFAVSDVHAELDGVPVPIVHVAASPVFGFEVVEGWDGYFGDPVGTHGIAMTAGEYVALPPLSVGEHALTFGGTYSEFGFTLDITYHLTVG